jgi:hypothetical protein
LEDCEIHLRDGSAWRRNSGSFERQPMKGCLHNILCRTGHCIWQPGESQKAALHSCMLTLCSVVAMPACGTRALVLDMMVASICTSGPASVGTSFAAAAPCSPDGRFVAGSARPSGRAIRQRGTQLPAGLGWVPAPRGSGAARQG